MVGVVGCLVERIRHTKNRRRRPCNRWNALTRAVIQKGSLNRHLLLTRIIQGDKPKYVTTVTFRSWHLKQTITYTLSLYDYCIQRS